MRLPASVLCGALLVATALPGTAHSSSASALAADGTVFTVTTGTYKQLFPAQATALNQDNPVLALDVAHPGQLLSRQLVPDTGGTEIESSPYLLLDDTGTLFLLWQTQVNVNSLLYLRSLQGGQWSAPILVLGNTFSMKGAPQISMTRDTFSVDDGNGGRVAIKRTLLNLMWWEDSSGGRVLYAPLVLINGEYQGDNQAVFVLNDFDTASDAPDPGISPALYQSPRILSGQSDRSVVMGFVNSRNGHLVTMEAVVLPGDLGVLGDAVRAHIITGGLQWQGNLNLIADTMRAHIITGGRTTQLSPRVLGFLGDAVRAHIITGGLSASDLQALGTDVRSFLLHSGAGLIQNGLTASSDSSALLEETTEGAAGLPTLPAHSVELRLVSSRPAPLTGPGASSLLVVSQDATRVTAAWDDSAGNVEYCESIATGWAPPVTLTVGPVLTRDAAYRLLNDRVRGH